MQYINRVNSLEVAMGSVNFLFAVSHKSALVIHISPASPSERTRSRDSFIVVYPTVPAAQRTARGLHGRRDAMAVDSRRVSWNGAALTASGCRRGGVVVVVVAFRGWHLCRRYRQPQHSL